MSFIGSAGEAAIRKSVQPLDATRLDRRKTRARSRPAPARADQSNRDKGSGTLSTLPDPVEEEDEEDEEDEDEELVDELDESSVIVTPDVCDTSCGGLLTLVTFSAKWRTPPGANPWP